jgi:hypothetical protein
VLVGLIRSDMPSLMEVKNPGMKQKLQNPKFKLTSWPKKLE